MREKLIELIDAVLLNLPWGEVTPHTAADIADRIIDSGICDESRWIPVTERLPEANKKVLGTKKGASAAFVFYGKWHNGNWYDLEWSCYRYGVTHWMPLPEPPKGE